MLAAAALTDHADEVVVLERDTFPAGPGHRKGLPQARHVHLLMAGGAGAMDRLLPGLTDRLVTAGARRLPMPTDMIVYAPQGWFRRWPQSHQILLCSRPLLDWVVRDRVSSHPRVTVRQNTEAVGPAGDASRITGVRLHGPDGAETLSADLVVDAGGRGSRASGWLTSLGVRVPRESRVDTGLVYASRLYRAPEGAGAFPVVAVQADPRAGVPGRGSVLEPVEGGRWLVTVYGTRGAEPSRDAAHFVPYARSARHPAVGDLIARAEPLSDVVVTRTTANRHRRYDRAAVWPDGFVVVGDAMAAYNPVYGHGMSVAAQGALALGETVAAHGLTARGTARRAQRAVARPAAAAWDLAVGQDAFYPGATAEGPSPRERLLSRYVGRVMRTATGTGSVARAVNDVMMLERSPAALLRPGVVAAALRGPRRPPLAGPPLTAGECAAVGVTPYPGPAS